MMKKIKLLWLSPNPVVPPLGGAIRTFYLIKHLKAGFDITVACPPFPAREALGAIKFLRDLDGVRILWANRFEEKKWTELPARIGYGLAEKAYWNFHPLWQKHLPFYRWHGFLARWITGERPDCVILDHVTGAETLKFLRRKFPGIRTVLNTHNVESLNLKRYLGLRARALKNGSLVRSQFGRILASESGLSECADRVWACSEKDGRVLDFLNRRAGMRSQVVPNGFEVPERFPGCGRREMRELIFTGILHYPPVREGLMWFFERVWPLLKKADGRVRFCIVGLNYRESLKDVFEGGGRVRVAENVPDVRPYYETASVSICPILSGSGTRVKILEAMSLGTPVVTTKVGREGIGAAPGRHLLQADTPADFAGAVMRLLEDGGLYERLSKNAYWLARERYDWRGIADEAGRLIGGLAGGGSEPAAKEAVCRAA